MAEQDAEAFSQDIRPRCEEMKCRSRGEGSCAIRVVLLGSEKAEVVEMNP